MSDIHNIGIEGAIMTPTSANYEQAISRRSATSILRPAYVVYPATVADVPRAIQFALSQDPPLEIAVKSGGCHSSNNASTEGGLVVDLSKLKAVTVAADKKTVAVQGGAVWGDVYTALEKHDLIVVGGNVWFVGVGGFLTGGGYSNLSPHHGLGIDNLVEAEVVLADGRIVRCNADEESDLFWAIRGGGNQFGIVTEFVLKAHPAHGPALVGTLGYPGTELKNVLKVLREFLATQGSNSWLILVFARLPPHFYPSVVLLAYVDGDQTAAEAALEPFRTKVTPVFTQTSTAPTFNVVSHGADAFFTDAPPRATLGGASFSELGDDAVEWVFGEWAKFSEDEATRETTVLFEFGKKGKIDSVGARDTAFPVRQPHYYSVVTANYSSPNLDKSSRDWVAKVTGFMKQENEATTGQKLCTPANFALGPEYESLEEVYGENLPRLRKVKGKYDPKKVWRRGWVIEPDLSA